MRKDHFLYRVYDLYVDGFRSMRLGRTLWAIIQQHAAGDEPAFVAGSLVERASPTPNHP